jgi:dTDP-4-amino-4,6-dideoxygalactose transaminase
MIQFNRPAVTGAEAEFVGMAMASDKMSGGGQFAEKCQQFFCESTGALACYVVPSCTAALEFSAILLNLSFGDEVILPSYTFVSTANAFALRGAKVVFADVDATTFNMGADQVRPLITPKTKAVVAVHYAGVSCEIDKLRALTDEYGLILIEDAAQAITSTYNGKALGTFGHLGTYSFHETKNVTAGGEGGLLLINDSALLERAAIIQEKGTNRKKFIRGEVDKYSWVDIGSSFLLGELSSAYLWGQITQLAKIQESRQSNWNLYHESLMPVAEKYSMSLSSTPNYNNGNAHLFFICIPNRERMIEHLLQHQIHSVFHYVPLHLAEAAQIFGEQRISLPNSEYAGESLLRLPLFYGLKAEQVSFICDVVEDFVRKSI